MPETGSGLGVAVACARGQADAVLRHLGQVRAGPGQGKALAADARDICKAQAAYARILAATGFTSRQVAKR